MPRPVIVLAAGFFLLCLLVQIWRLESLSATYDQALFLQELWSTDLLKAAFLRFSQDL